MKKLLSIFFIILFFSCSKKSENNLPRLFVPKHKNVVEVNSKEMLHIPKTNIIEKGFDRDIKVFENNENSENEFWKKHKEEYQYFKNSDTIFPKYDFKIIIDTSYTFSTKGFQYKFIHIPSKQNRISRNGLINDKYPTKVEAEKAVKLMTEYINKTYVQEKIQVNCYPLLIKNKDNKIAYINSDYLKVIQQAKDIDGKWKPIEFYSEFHGCIRQSEFYKFLPKKYIGISIIKYNGNLKTKLRVKIQINNHYYFSNEIECLINRSQFNQDYLNDYIDFTFQRKLTDSDYMKIRKAYFLEERL